jgi:hypothetical protein
LKSNGDLQLSSVTGDTRVEVCFGPTSSGGQGLTSGAKVQECGASWGLDAAKESHEENHLLSELSLD